MEARLQIFTLFLFLCYLETLFRGPLQVGGGVITHNAHIMNTVYTIFPEVPNEKVFLMIIFLHSLWWVVGQYFTGLQVLHASNFKASVD